MPEVCVVVPCYNEERRLNGRELLAFLDTHPAAALCLVDDGSSDGTLKTLQTLQSRKPSQILVHHLPTNSGKAEAVRAGVLHAAGRNVWPMIGYFDADLSTPLTEVDRLQAVLQANPRCKLVLGSRVKRLGSHIDRRISRHVLGRIFAACASGILGLSVYDSQCGAKLFHADLVPILFAEPFLTRWLFDLEMLARLRNHAGGLEMTAEVPLARWSQVSGSKLKPRDMVVVPIELLRIRRRYNRPRA